MEVAMQSLMGDRKATKKPAGTGKRGRQGGRISREATSTARIPNSTSSGTTTIGGAVTAIQIDPRKVHAFAAPEDFYAWLKRHHDTEEEVWIKIHKVGSGLASITPKQAID